MLGDQDDHTPSTEVQAEVDVGDLYQRFFNLGPAKATTGATPSPTQSLDDLLDKEEGVRLSPEKSVSQVRYNDEDTFVVDVGRCGEPGTPLGLDVKNDNGTIVIARIKDGLVLRYNEKNPYAHLRVGDHIVGANGTRGTAKKVLQALCSSTQKKLVIWRKQEPFVVTVAKNDEEKWGLKLDHCGDFLEVGGIKPGLAMDRFNKAQRAAGSSDVVVEGYRIVKANGVEGDADDMVQAVQAAGNLLPLVVLKAWPARPREIHGAINPGPSICTKP